MYGSHFDQFVIAGAPVAHDPTDVDDVAAVDTNEPFLVEARFDIADCERAK